MTAVDASGPRALIAAGARGIGRIIRLIVDVYRLGLAAWRLAPGFVAIAAATEFAQHIVEIRIGMFASLASAKALQNDALRWDFGYAKIAGLIITMILVGRFWGVGKSWRKALLLPPATVGRAILAIALLAASTYLLISPRLALPMGLDIVGHVSGWVIQCGLILWLGAILFEVPGLTLRRAFTSYLPSAIVMQLLFVAAMVPAQLPHRLAHYIVMGQPAAVVWFVMALDAAVIGTMAALGGSALYLGSRCGLTWRGWRPFPSEADGAR